MHPVTKFALIMALLGAASEPAIAQQVQHESRGYYLEGAGGANWLGKSDGFYQLRPDHPLLPNLELPASTSYETGWAIAGRYGYAWLSGLRADVELSYRHNKVDKSDFTGTDGVIFFPATDPGAHGHVRSIAVIVNAYYDFINTTGITPYLGAGIGAANVGGKYQSSFEPITQHANTLKDSDWGFAVQAIGGVSIALSPQLSLVADYRYLRAFDISTSEQQFPPAGPAQAFAAARIGGRGDYENHTVMLGLRYSFRK